MKKYFFFAAAALLALAACSKVTPVAEPDQEIGFSVVNRMSGTKADNDTQEGDAKEHFAFYEGKSFNVFAFANSGDWSDNASSVDAKYMNDVAISKTGDVWKATAAYYWPKQAKLSFAAYSPSSATAPTITKVAATETTEATINYAFGTEQVPYTVSASNKAEYADDLMVADFVKDLQANPAVTHFTAGVPILFNHLLTKLTFKFNRALYNNANVDEANSYITLTSVKIADHYYKGNYSNVSGSYDTNKWAVTTDKVTSTVNGTSTNGLTLGKPADTPTFAEWGDPIIVLPQDLFVTSGEGDAATTAAGPQMLELTYTIVTKYVEAAGGATVTEEDIPASIPLYLEALPSWGINKSIVYNVTINPLAKDEILFDPAIVNWTDGGTYTINIQ